MVRARTKSNILLLCLVITGIILASEKVNCQKSDTLFIEVDELAGFPGGVNKLTEFMSLNLSKSIRLEVAKNKRSYIRHLPVLASFVVEKDGLLTNIDIELEADSSFAAEAGRIVALMPKWIPAKKNGQPVRSQITLPISFYLGENAKRRDNGSKFEYDGYEYAWPILGFTYENAFFFGSIGKHLKSGQGATFEFAALDDEDDDDNLGFGIYYTWIRTAITEPFDRRNTIWQTGRHSSLNELGVKWSYRIFPNRRFEIFPVLQAAPIWHRPSNRYATDTGLGINSLGFTFGLGLHANWFFTDTANDNFHVFHLHIIDKQMYMPAPLKGNNLTIGIGWTWVMGNG